MFADRTILPPFPTLPAPSTLSPWAIASGCHGNKIFPSQPLSSGPSCHTSKHTHFLSIQALRLIFQAYLMTQTTLEGSDKRPSFFPLPSFIGKTAFAAGASRTAHPVSSRWPRAFGSTGSITYTFRVRGRSRRSA